MDIVTLINLLQGGVAVVDAASRVGPMLQNIRAQIDTARAKGEVSAEQDALISAEFAKLEANGFEFQPSPGPGGS